MSFVSKGHSINCNSVTLGGIYANSSNSIDIRHSDPNKNILVNGILPSAGGGGGGVPAIGDIDFIGNLNCNDVVGGGSKGIITAQKKINSGLGGVESTGLIKTGATGDIHSGKDLLFDGQDIYKSYPGVEPPIANKTYKDYRGLVATGDNAIFTGEPVFRKTIKLQTSAGVPPAPVVLTDQITLNSNGTIQCANANIGAALTVGTITCDNGGTNECKARVFNTRTSGIDGWSMKQDTPSVPAAFGDNVLQFTASQAGSFLTVASSDHDPSSGVLPSIIIDPVTVANGGRIQCAETIFGTTANRFIIKQDNGGGLDNILQINAGSASGEVRFRDNDGQDKMRVTKTAIVLGSTIPVSFGAYVFRPVELVLNFTGATLDANPSALFNSLNTNFTRTNDGASVTLNSQGEEVYHLTIDATSSSGSTVGSSRFMCLFPYMVSANAAGQFVFSGNYCMNTTPPGGFTTPVIEGDGTGGPAGSTNYSFAFPSITGTETFNGTVRITRVNY